MEKRYEALGQFYRPLGLEEDAAWVGSRLEKIRLLHVPRGIPISARIIRILLTDRDRTWTQKELLPRTHVSSGLASRIVQHLVSQGFLEKKSPRQFRLRDPLDAWVKADDFARRNTTTRYTAFGGAPLEMARQLKFWADQQSGHIAFTQWVAGWLRHPYTEPVIASAYVARLPKQPPWND